MTNQEYICSLSRRELAEILIRYEERPDYDYDLDGNLYQCCTLGYWITSDGQEFDDIDKAYAVQHECYWLSKQVGEKLKLGYLF